jgi:hypothetical protein
MHGCPVFIPETFHKGLKDLRDGCRLTHIPQSPSGPLTDFRVLASETFQQFGDLLVNSFRFVMEG